MFTFYYRNYLTSVYEKQTEAEEIFYQPIIKQGSRADNSPLGIDMTWSFDIHSLNDMLNLRKFNLKNCSIRLSMFLSVFCFFVVVILK